MNPHQQPRPQEPGGPAGMQQEPAKWTSHEHQAAPVTQAAQQLVDLAGSRELAKHAVEDAEELAAHRAAEELREVEVGAAGEMSRMTSTFMTADGAVWRLEELSVGGWLVSNDSQRGTAMRFNRREDAEEYLRGLQAGDES